MMVRPGTYEPSVQYILDIYTLRPDDVTLLSKPCLNLTVSFGRVRPMIRQHWTYIHLPSFHTSHLGNCCYETIGQ